MTQTEDFKLSTMFHYIRFNFSQMDEDIVV